LPGLLSADPQSTEREDGMNSPSPLYRDAALMRMREKMDDSYVFLALEVWR
jgi:hypothetical protein